MGADRKIARWDKMVDMGPSTMGNPFLLVVISSPANLAKLDRLRQVNLRISDPRGLAEAEVKKLVAKGKAVVCQSMSLHATEIGGTQMAAKVGDGRPPGGDRPVAPTPWRFGVSSACARRHT